MDPKKRNLQLPTPVDQLLEVEQGAGATITGTVSSALYWYFKRLDAHQRELARLECHEWLESGRVPPSAIATELEEVLRGARERGLRRSRR